MIPTHTIETRDGKASLFYVNRKRPESWRSNPWGFSPEQAETTTEDKPLTWEDAFAKARADFEVEERLALMPSQTGGKTVEMPGFKSLARKGDHVHPDSPLSIVTDTYGTVQNLRMIALMKATGLTPDSVAVLDDGRRLYAQALAGDDEQVRAGPTGVVRTFHTLMWGFTTGVAIRWGKTRWGIVCANTYAKAGRDLDSRIVHSKNADARVVAEIARTEAEVKADQAWLDTARRMAEITTGRADATMIVASSVDSEAKSYADLSGPARRTVESVMAILDRADEATGVVGDGSLWDVFQAVTFYTSHQRTVRGLDGAAAEVARMVAPLPDLVPSAWDALAGVVADHQSLSIARA